MNVGLAVVMVLAFGYAIIATLEDMEKDQSLCWRILSLGFIASLVWSAVQILPIILILRCE